MHAANVHKTQLQPPPFNKSSFEYIYYSEKVLRIISGVDTLVSCDSLFAELRILKCYDLIDM